MQNHSLASHVLGNTDIDGKGIAGIDAQMGQKINAKGNVITAKL